MDRSNRQFVIITLVVVAIFAALNNIVRRAPLGDWWSTIVLLLLALFVWALGRPRRHEAEVEETPIEPIIYERPASEMAGPAYTPLLPQTHPEAAHAAPAPVVEKTVEPLPQPVTEKPVAEIKAAPTGLDDLKIVEGIGPKMEKALHAAGIQTFAQLAQATEAQIRAAIQAAGMRFAPSVPTWPEQAAYAQKGDWEGLKTFQATLTAGRRAK
jgi:predicted flap endonuclease-1-like 5' DNA nuclease